MDKMGKTSVRILERLEEAGFEAYLVGGCVRDIYLGLIPCDYDICTNARPEEVLQVFAHAIPTGLQHGTVTVIEQGEAFEVTTFRVESAYQDHRHPTAVHFVSRLKDDLSRRDFTMNAMAQDRHGRFYDYFAGRQAIQAKEIRCVGDPSQRFTEDALRMIRAVRFASQFQFSLDEKLIQGIQTSKETLIHLSIERIVSEIEKIWQSSCPSVGFKLCWELELFAHAPVFASWEWRAVQAHHFSWMDQITDRVVHWAFLFYLGKIDTEEISPICYALRLSSKDRKAISACSREADCWPEHLSTEQGKHFLLHQGHVTTLRAYQLSQLRKNQEPDSRRIEQINQWWNEMPVKKTVDLAINGYDLMKYTARPAGPWIRQTLNQLLEAVAFGRLPNQAHILLKEGHKIGAANS